MSDSISNQPSLPRLVADLLDGQLAPEEAEQLDDLLMCNTDHREEYRHQVFMHAMLRWRHGNAKASSVQDVDYQVIAELLDEAEETARDASAKATREEARRAAEREAKQLEKERRLNKLVRRPQPIVIPWSVVYATGGSLAVGVFMLVYSLWSHDDLRQPVQSGPTSTRVAIIHDSVDAQWGDPELSVEAGTQLDAGKLILTRGFVQIAFDGGATTLIEAPAELELISADQARLVWGRLVGLVPTKARGFTIQTPAATIIDLGTEFGVDAGQEGRCEIQVLTGEVKIGLNRVENGPKAPTRLSAGSAVQVDKQGKMKEIAFNEDKYVRRMPRFVYVPKVVPASLDARLVDLDNDGKGDRVDPLALPPVPSEVNGFGTRGNKPQSRVGVGEWNNVDGADQDQRRYWIAFSLTQTECNEIPTAGSIQLAITLAEKNNINRLRVDLYGVLDPMSLTPKQHGYEASSELLVAGAINEQTPMERQLLLDVTDFAKAQVGKGHKMLAFRLQSDGIPLPNRDSIHNSFVFHTKQTEQESQVPALHMRARRYDRSSRIGER